MAASSSNTETEATVADGDVPSESVEKGRTKNPPMGKLRRTVRELGLALITLGVATLLFVAYQLWGTGIAESHSQASLKHGFAASVAHNGGGDNPLVGKTTGPLNPGPAIGGAIDHLVIPKIGVNKYVVQGVSDDDLRKGPGHYPETVMPGQDGNAAIAGHRTTYGAPFFRLNELKVGDLIYITDTADRTFLYKVSQAPFAVDPGDTAVLDNTPYPQLTLTSCTPRYSATQRLIVIARLTGRPPLPVTKPPAPPPGVVTAGVANLGEGRSSAWPGVIGYGALFVVLWVGVRLLINRTRRWWRVAAYVGGIALCLVPLWFCFENIVLLLPQSI